MSEHERILSAFLGKLWPIRAPLDKGDCVSVLSALLCSRHQLQEPLPSDLPACLSPSTHNQELCEG